MRSCRSRKFLLTYFHEAFPGVLLLAILFPQFKRTYITFMHAWRDFDLRCFLGKLGILDRRPVPLSVAIRRAYADYSKYLECCRKAGRRWYYRNHQEQLERATRYRQANRKPVARRQREWIKRKLEADPTHPAKDLSSDQLEKA